jgi:hypothetical protein
MDIKKCIAMSVDLMPPPGAAPGMAPGQGGPPQPPGPMPDMEKPIGM